MFCDLAHPAGIAMPPACYLFCPSHSTTGGRIATRIVALTPSVKNSCG